MQASKFGASLTEFTHKTYEAADGYMKKYEASIKGFESEASKDEIKRLIMQLRNLHKKSIITSPQVVKEQDHEMSLFYNKNLAETEAIMKEY